MPWALLLIFSLGLVAINADSLSHEEAYSAWVVYDSPLRDTSMSAQLRAILNSPLDALRRLNEQNLQPPLYYLLLDSWVQLQNESLWMLRLPSLLCALIALAAFYRLLHRLRGGLVALLITVLLGSNPLFWGQVLSAEPLGLALALWALASLALFAFWRRRRFWSVALYILLIGLALLTHLFSFVLILLHLAAWLIARSGWRPVAIRLTAFRPRSLVAVFVLLFGLQILAGALIQNRQPGWAATISRVASTRNALEPALFIYAPDSPSAYYARQIPLRQGISIDAGWQNLSPDDLAELADYLASAQSVWAYVDKRMPGSEDLIRILQEQGRDSTYEERVGDMHFIRFVRNPYIYTLF